METMRALVPEIVDEPDTFAAKRAELVRCLHTAKGAMLIPFVDPLNEMVDNIRPIVDNLIVMRPEDE